MALYVFLLKKGQEALRTEQDEESEKLIQETRDELKAGLEKETEGNSDN